jgi:aminoglycoside phosphotransferase family enzyme
MTPSTAPDTSRILLARLKAPQAYPDAVEHVHCVETHISWVLLTGTYAYKIKKPVSLGFLDFSTLALRRAACLEELRLNRRQAASLYIDVVPIAGPPDAAAVLGDGEPIEYAVRMHQFPQAAQLDRLLEAGELGPEDMVRCARQIAAFHGGLPPAAAGGAYGTPAAAWQPVEDNFRTLRESVSDASLRVRLDSLERWSRTEFETLRETFAARLKQGFVRECHGDLHLGNLVRLGSEILPFDCIEFSPALRWIDVISDIAFLMMDLLYRGRPQLAYHLINAYLESSGDYAGLSVLRYYLSYRALVRAKVAVLRGAQGSISDAEVSEREAGTYMALAQRLASPAPPVLLLMHGLSGSGKSRLSGELMVLWPAIRIRSDVERKRIHGYASTASSGSRTGAGIYTPEAGAATYQRLADCAKTALAAGHCVIVDAASLQWQQREKFRSLAETAGVGFAIIDCVAPEPELRRRLRLRASRGDEVSEADEAVLDNQLRHAEPLREAERAMTLSADPVSAADPAALVARLARLLAAERQSAHGDSR